MLLGVRFIIRLFYVNLLCYASDNLDIFFLLPMPHLKYFWMESGSGESQNFVKRGHVSLGGVLFARKVGISWIIPDFYIAQSSGLEVF